MKIAIIRGSYFNKYEMQNYEPLARKFDITGFSGLKPIHEKYAFPLIKLPSPVDLPNFPLKMPILNRLCLGDAMYLVGLEESLKGFDVVHVRETYFHFTQQALNAKKKGYVKKVVCTCSETIPFNHEGILGRKRFKKRAIREVDVFHCLTKKAKQCLIKEGCDKNKILVFPYGIDLKKFTITTTKTITIPASKPRILDRIVGTTKTINILFIGRLVKEKGIYDLLKIFISLVKSGKKVRLTMIGNGKERDNIINLINQIRVNFPNISRKIFLQEQIKYSLMVKEFAKADIFCLFSKPTKHWEEYFGMVLIEAMACGLPIVSTKCGVIPEVIGKAGILNKPGDWQAGFRGIKKLIEKPALRKKLSKLAYKRAKELFDSKKTSKNIEKLWLK